MKKKKRRGDQVIVWQGKVWQDSGSLIIALAAHVVPLRFRSVPFLTVLRKSVLTVR